MAVEAGRRAPVLAPTIQSLGEQGSVPRDQVALLVDRVLRHDGVPQRYGTQFSLVDGKLVMDPVEDSAGLDARRSTMGLPPIAEYERMLEQAYKYPVAKQP